MPPIPGPSLWPSFQEFGMRVEDESVPGPGINQRSERRSVVVELLKSLSAGRHGAELEGDAGMRHRVQLQRQASHSTANHAAK
eukprot:CAMPEP_0170618090 /NCGR_PEP_ID=MMETSP0224-20130122/26771_1 /TAXON_ID=285029 /ORGANISM="Togula jolla, Strain CCCM 725" /LENGTH=82 /DNA_ID=CAMNT_0010944037 /DNA_START=84 /DNA_END=332 /DNA_ORIENTATION=-